MRNQLMEDSVDGRFTRSWLPNSVNEKVNAVRSDTQPKTCYVFDVGHHRFGKIAWNTISMTCYAMFVFGGIYGCVRNHNHRERRKRDLAMCQATMDARLFSGGS